MTSPRETAKNTAVTGAVASGAITSITSAVSKNVPNQAAKLGQKLMEGSGFDQLRSYHSLIISAILFFAGGGYLITLLPRDWAGLIMLLFVIVGCAVGFGVTLSLAFQFHRYSAIKLRCRIYPVDKPDINAGQSLTGNVLTDAIFVAPVKLALFALIFPFWVLTTMGEVIRVIGMIASGKPYASFRGDQGKYYDRVREEYAKRFSTAGEFAAIDYLRIAYSGLLSPVGQEIPRKPWHNGAYKEWLSPMIERHGPIDLYCKPFGARA